MNIELSEAVKKAIEQSLSGEVANSLKVFIEEANANKAKLNAHEYVIKGLREDNVALLDELRVVKDVGESLLRAEQLKSAAADELRKAFEIKVECRADIATAKFETLQNMMTLLFKNTVVREDTVKNVGKVMPGVPAGPQNSLMYPHVIDHKEAVSVTKSSE